VPYRTLQNGLLSSKYPSLSIVLCRIPLVCSQASLMNHAESLKPAPPVFHSLELTELYQLVSQFFFEQQWVKCPSEWTIPLKICNTTTVNVWLKRMLFLMYGVFTMSHKFSVLLLCLTGVMQNLFTRSPVSNLSNFTSISGLLLVS
jgi:hypothetical protein